MQRAQREVRSASAGITASMAAIGVSVGAAQLGRFVLEADKVATAYRRQSVAAVTLAGSQAKLNQFLSVYEDAMGGAVAKAEAMANVTKLMSVGFADSASELDQFARAIRGISIAMGTSEDTVTQNLILELFTQRGARLDQLGLQYDKVKARAAELAAADKSLTAQQAYQNAVLEQAKIRFGALTDAAAGQKTGIEKLGIAWENFKLQFGEEASGGTNIIFEQWAADIERATSELRQFSDFLEKVKKTGQQLRFDSGISGFDPNANYGSRTSIGRVTPTHIGDGSAPRFTEEQTDAIADFYRSSMDAERAAHNERLQATVDYERQRTQTIRDFGKSMAREEEDFNLARARSLRDYERSVLSIMRDAQKREAKAQADLAESLAEMRAKSTERLADIETNYNRARERAADSYGKSLRDAAGRLDAKRISELQADYKTQEDERKESYNDQLTKERANLAESIAEAQKAHAERLQDARDADAERLSDMRLNRALQQADEDADRVTRKNRAFQDHNDQLAEMDRLHAERMTQIDNQLLQEKTRYKTALDEFLGRTKDATDAAIAYYDAVNNALIGPRPLNSMITPGQFPSLLGGGSTSPIPQSNGAAGNGGTGRVSSVTISAGAVVIYAAASQSPTAIGAAVREELGKILKEVAA